MTEEILTSLLGLSGPEVLALKLGASLAADLLRHPRPEPDQPDGVLSATSGRLRVRLMAIKRAPMVAARVEQRLQAVPGVREVRANPVTGTVLVGYDATVLDTQVIQRAIERATAALRIIAADPEYQLPRPVPNVPHETEAIT